MTTTANSEPRREVLYLSHDGLTDALGQSQILPYLLGLARDYRITAITFEKPGRFQKSGAQCQKICDGGNVRWIPLRYHKFPPVMSTVYDLLILRSTVKRLISENRVAAIHCRSYPTALTGLWAKRKFGVKYIFDMRGFWADERIEAGLWNRGNPLFRLIYNFFKGKEKQFIREADHIVSLTENARSEIRSWKLGETPVGVIPTCVDLDHFKSSTAAAQEKLRVDLGISPADFVLVYLGSWGTWYLTDEMLDFFSVLESSMPAKLVLLTPDAPDLSRFHLASKVIVRHVHRSEVPAYLSIGNAAICFIKPSFSKKASSATKIAEAWAMNLPVVVNPGWGDVDELAQSGFPLILCQEKADYARVVSQLRTFTPVENRQMLAGRFDLLTGIRKYEEIYQSLGLLR